MKEVPPKRVHRVSFKTVLWFIFITTTLLCIIDGFVNSGDAVCGRASKNPAKLWSSGKNVGEIFANLVWRVAARMIIPAQNAMFCESVVHPQRHLRVVSRVGLNRRRASNPHADASFRRHLAHRGSVFSSRVSRLCTAFGRWNGIDLPSSNRVQLLVPIVEHELDPILRPRCCNRVHIQ